VTAPGGLAVRDFSSSVTTPATAAQMAGHGGVVYFRCRPAGAASPDVPFYACALRPGAPGSAVAIYDAAPPATVSSFPLVAGTGAGSPAAVIFHTTAAPGSGDAGGLLWAVAHAD
jgi:hypothetical protein